MMSHTHEGKVLDYRYKKIMDCCSAFYIGDIYVGQIFKVGNSWSVVGKHPNPLSPIEGLKTRWQAAQLLLKMEGFIKKSFED